MRIAIVMLFALLAGSALDTAQADPYRWCAIYSGGGEGGGGTNCYFVTLDQCKAAASGGGSFCTPNTLYDGKPVTIPGEAPRRSGARAPR